tara:strand:- start:7301 stop:7867 length:567 start_codon:yes stop_codon:yes gene_type:complete
MVSNWYIADKKHLLQMARSAIEYGLLHQQVMPINTSQLSEHYQEIGACFITINKNNALRGCIGSIEAHRPLAEDIIYNAYQAAFCDPRFPALQKKELTQIKINISILTEPLLREYHDEQTLIQSIKVGVEGLIIQDGANRATFLPSVWGAISDPREFVKQLKLKAGLAENYWSDSICCYVYEVIYIEE